MTSNYNNKNLHGYFWDRRVRKNSQSYVFLDLTEKAKFSKINQYDCNGTRTHNHLVCTVYELSGCAFESLCSHLNLRYCACFEQGVP